MNNNHSVISNQQSSIVFFGSGLYGLTVLENLRKELKPTLIFTTENEDSSPVSQFAIKNNIQRKKVFNLTKNDFIEQIKNSNPTIGILASFGEVIPTEVLKAFPKGILNIHPSLLPKYRGPTPGQTTILNGDEETGVTIIKMDEKIDHGPIVVQEKEHVESTDTGKSLYLRLFKKGTILLSNIIEQYSDESIEIKEQDDLQATYTKPLKREDGFINFCEYLKNENFKLEIGRKIRAFHPWPGVWTKVKLNDQKTIVKFLPKNKIQVEGKNPMSFKDFLNGYPNAPEDLKKLLASLN